MLKTRVIPILLIQNKGLVKSIQFKKNVYIGDPINAVRIFNEKEVDEIVVLDIMASKESRVPNFELIAEIGSEAFVPFGYGGGITEIQHVKKLMYAGAEKVILNSVFLKKPEFVTEVSNTIGSSSTVISIDYKKKFLGKNTVFCHTTKSFTNLTPIDAAKKAEQLGAGEIVLNSVDRDGMMQGYDIDILSMVTSAVSIPVIACGGSGSFHHMKEAIVKGNADAVAAGSQFVFHGKHKAVLISYLSKVELKELRNNE